MQRKMGEESGNSAGRVLAISLPTLVQRFLRYRLRATDKIPSRVSNAVNSIGSCGAGTR